MFDRLFQYCFNENRCWICTCICFVLFCENNFLWCLLHDTLVFSDTNPVKGLHNTSLTLTCPFHLHSITSLNTNQPQNQYIYVYISACSVSLLKSAINNINTIALRIISNNQYQQKNYHQSRPRPRPLKTNTKISGSSSAARSRSSFFLVLLVSLCRSTNLQQFWDWSISVCDWFWSNLCSRVIDFCLVDVDQISVWDWSILIKFLFESDRSQILYCLSACAVQPTCNNFWDCLRLILF